MRETPKNNTIQISGYHPVTPTIKKISVSKIKEQIIQDRFGLEVDDLELEHISGILSCQSERSYENEEIPQTNL